MYIVDSNVLLEAANNYYSFEIAPGFWKWLESEILDGRIRSIGMVKEELDFPDDLVVWVERMEAEGFFLDESRPDIQQEVAALSQWVVNNGDFGPQHVAKFLNKADPWIIATAKCFGASVATQEKPIGSGSNKIKIPNVCTHAGVEHANTFRMMQDLGAKIG